MKLILIFRSCVPQALRPRGGVCALFPTESDQSWTKHSGIEQHNQHVTPTRVHEFHAHTNTESKTPRLLSSQVSNISLSKLARLLIL